MTAEGITTRALGERAILIEAPGWEPASLAGAIRAAAARTAAPGAGHGDAGGKMGLDLEELVPAATTVLAVVRRPEDLIELRAVVDQLRGRRPEGAAPRVAGEEVEIPVRYDGADLDEVARACGSSIGEVIRAHEEAAYRAAFCGFAPGFAYLSGLPESLRLPRRSSPRPSVTAGSVAIADGYCAVYPTASPGGWHLIGHTEAPVWDLDRRPPALLGPGTAVRFVAVGRTGGPHRTGPAATPRRSGPAAKAAPRRDLPGAVLTVLRPGLLTTTQDAGRPGLADQGVAPSGWLDAPAARLANRLVGNEETAAVLEATMGGLSLRLDAPPARSRAIAVTGAEIPVTVDGRPVTTHAPIEVTSGSRVELGWVTAGARAYVAVSGGLDVPPVLGSRSTDVLSGLGPPPLVTGQRLTLGDDAGRRSGLDVAPVPPPIAEPMLRVLPGPRASWLGPGALQALTATVWTVGAASNRVGLRLTGAVLERPPRGELAPEGLVTGAVQVPPSGEPVLFLADHPVTGGYPVLAVVVEADLHLLAQVPPGGTLRFAIGRRR